MLETKTGPKVGLHGNQTPTGAGQIIQEALNRGYKLTVVKSVNNGGMILESKRLSPDTITIWRIYKNPDLDGRDLDVYTDIESIANERVAEIINNSSLEERAATDYFECHNENHPKTKAGWIRWAELQKLFVLKLAAYGLKAAVGGLNCGTPEYWEMRWVLETGLMQVINQYGGIFTIHEGALPMQGTPPDATAMWGMTGQIPESPVVPGGGLLTFRYRFWLYLAEEMGITFPPIVISEFYPSVIKPLTNLSPEQIAEIYRQVDIEMAKDPEIVAYLPFCVGGPGWESEQHGFAYAKMLEVLAAFKNRQNVIRGEVPPPPPAPEPTIAKVRPNVRNLRTDPSTNVRVLAAVTGGQTVELLDKHEEWYKVKYEVEGWMHESGLEI